MIIAKVCGLLGCWLLMADLLLLGVGDCNLYRVGPNFVALFVETMCPSSAYPEGSAQRDEDLCSCFMAKGAWRVVKRGLASADVPEGKCFFENHFYSRSRHTSLQSTFNSVLQNNRQETLFFFSFFFFFFFISLVAKGPHHYHPACGHKGSSHLSPVHALQYFYRDASSALLQLVNQWLNFT